MNSHEKIYENLGILTQEVKGINQRLDKLNGNIPELWTQINYNKENIVLFKSTVENIYDFMREQKEQKEKNQNFWDTIKQNWLIILMTNICTLVFAWIFKK